MTVTSTVSRNDYVGTGSTGPFVFGYRIYTAQDLYVAVQDLAGSVTVLNYPTDFSISAGGIGARTGGSITLTVALAANFKLTIQRNRALTQLINYRNQGATFPQNVEDGFDQNTMLIQQLDNLILSSVQLPSTISPATFSTVLPTTLSPGNAIVVNALGNGFSMGALSAATLSAWFATNQVRNDVYTSALGQFTPGVTTTLTLSAAPGGLNNLFISQRVSGAVVLLESDQYSVAGSVVTFTSPIPAGCTRVEIKYFLTYQINTADSRNVTYVNAAAVASDVQTELRAVDALITTLNTNVTRLQGEVMGLWLKDFGVVGDGTTDDTTAFQAALTAGASQHKVVYGGAFVCKITSGLTVSGPGLVFDQVTQGTAGSVGILVSGTGYTALTVSGSPNAMNVTVYGTGNAANGIFFNNPVRGIVSNVRAYNLAGFGVRIDKMYDCLFGSISVELIDASTSAFGAFSINDGGDTSNQSHILRLQVENCTGNVINISPNTLDCVIDTIHSERAVCTNYVAGNFVVGVQYQIVTIGTTDFTLIGASANTLGLTFQATGVGAGTGTAAAITWILGGASSLFNEARFNKSSGTAKLWLRGAYSTYTSMRAESGINVDLEGTSTTGLVLISPNFSATTREFPSQSGMLMVLGGTIGTWSGNRSNLFGCFNPDGGNWRMNGNLTLGTAGNEIYVKQGANATSGRAVLVAGTVTVSTTAVGTNLQEIMLTYAGVANVAHIGTLYIANIVAGTSFDIKSTNAADDSNVSWSFAYGRA